MMRLATLISFTMLLGLAMHVAAVAAPETRPQQPAAPLAPGTEEPAQVSPRLNLTLEQRHVIKEIIKDLKNESGPAEIQPKIGEPVPSEIKLQPMPSQVAQKVPQIKSHVYFLTSEQIVIVDPKDNKVADMIKLAAD
jgi:hypothetical protein